MSRIIDPLEQFFDDAGNPLIEGLLYFYETGTNTPLDTFSDVNLTTPNTNPVQLTASGRCPNTYGYNQLYRVVLKSSADVQIMQRDNVGSLSGDGSFTPWIFDKIYNKPDITVYEDKFYLSKVDNNQDNQPDISTQWAQIRFLEDYKSGFAYSKNDVVFSGFIPYLSLVDANTGNTPVSSPNQWERIGSIPKYSTNRTYAQYDLAIDANGVLQVSQQNTNLNHNPVGDSGAWWKPQWQTVDGLTQVKYLSGDGALSPYWDNWLTDSSSYSIPAANTVPANTALVVTKPDKYRTSTPTVTMSGGDYLESSAANDFGGIQLLNSRIEVFKFISNGSNGWRIG